MSAGTVTACPIQAELAGTVTGLPGIHAMGSPNRMDHRPSQALLSRERPRVPPVCHGEITPDSKQPLATTPLQVLLVASTFDAESTAMNTRMNPRHAWNAMRDAWDAKRDV
jgi:hypothetical protein